MAEVVPHRKGERAFLRALFGLSSLLIGAQFVSIAMQSDAPLGVNAEIQGPDATGATFILIDGRQATLRNGTGVTIECRDGSDTFLARIRNGQFAGAMALSVPRADLHVVESSSVAPTVLTHDPMATLLAC